MDLEISKNELILPPKKEKISPKITIYPFWKDIWKDIWTFQISWIINNLWYYYTIFFEKECKSLASKSLMFKVQKEKQ